MEIISRINWVDVLVIIVVIRISYTAFKEGLSHEIFPLFGSIFIAVLSLHYYIKLGYLISQNILKMPLLISNFLSFLLLAVIAGSLFKLIKLFLDKIIRVEWNPFIEKVGGIIAGVFRAFVAASLILIVLALMPLPYLQRSIRDRSLTGMYVLRIAPVIYSKVSGFMPTLKMGTAPADRESMVRALASDKSMAPAKTEKKAGTIREWERVPKF